MIKDPLKAIAPAIKDALEMIVIAARSLFANWKTLLTALALYAALLTVTHLFFAVVKEATRLDVFLTVFVLPVAAFALFFSLQGIGLNYTRVGATPVPLLKRALRDCWKLLLASLPVVLLAFLVVYFIDFLKPEPGSGATSAAPTTTGARPVLEMIGQGVWYVSLCFVLPLLAIHSWIAAAREGVDAALKILGRRILTAFSPRSMLIYVLVVAPFGAVSRFLFLTTTYVNSDWGELWLFGLRLVLAFLMIFVGWLIVLGALAEMSARRVTGQMNELDS